MSSTLAAGLSRMMKASSTPGLELASCTAVARFLNSARLLVSLEICIIKRTSEEKSHHHSTHSLPYTPLNPAINPLLLSKLQWIM
jgi:hypothetical protein